MTSPWAISVVIPTRGRPDSLAKALASVVGQTMPPAEIVVVADGPEEDTVAMLRDSGIAGLRTIEIDVPGGASAARNAGVLAATGEWIAFLDDDDEWLPRKLERQVDAIRAAGVAEAIGSCAVIVREAGCDVLWRGRAPRSGEPISEYLFVRRSLRVGEGTVGTSTLLVRRAVLLAIPFDRAVHRYQDADWLLRAGAAGAELVWCPEPLSIWNAPGARGSITAAHASDWRYAVAWIRARRHLVTPRAYAAFLLVRVAALAASDGDRAALRILWREAWRAGRPGLLDVVLFGARQVMPDGLRRRFRRGLTAVDPTVET